MTHPTANQIEAELRKDFRARAREYGQDEDRNDPVISLLFRTFADQIEGLYKGLDSAQLSLLDELIGAVEMEPRTARPAQSVVRFRALQPTVVDPGLSLVGEAESGERLTFLTDAGLTVSRARIAAGLTYQDGSLQLLSGIDLPEDVAALRPNFGAVRANLGSQPAIYLALDNLPPSHVGMQGFFFDLNPRCETLHRTLPGATWCLAGENGEFGATGLMRSRKGNAGARMLQWLIPPGDGAGETKESAGPSLPDGFYAGRVFRLPPVPPGRRGVTGAPASIGPALEKVFTNAARVFFSTPRAWIRISMPPGVENLQTSINTIAANSVSCSNLECVNQFHEFKRQGLSIPVSVETGGKGCFVAIRSISDKRNREYLPRFQADPDRTLGRYSLHGGRLDADPALDAAGEPEDQAALRVWVTNGKIGNKVSANKIVTLANPHVAPGLQVTGLTGAAGGTNGEELPDVKSRFAAKLRSRDRIVTEADLLTLAQDFDQRITGVAVEQGVELGETGLKTVQTVTLAMSRGSFSDGEEVRVLLGDLQRFLQDRSMAGVAISLKENWS